MKKMKGVASYGSRVLAGSLGMAYDTRTGQNKAKAVKMPAGKRRGLRKG